MRFKDEPYIKTSNRYLDAMYESNNNYMNRIIERMKLTESEQETIKAHLIERCKAQYIKFGTKKFYQEQASFVAGVSATLCAIGKTIPPYWSIACMSDREIVEKF